MTGKSEKIQYWNYISRTLKWLIGNTIFGLFPLFIMTLIYYLSNGRSCADEVSKLINEGLLHFFCLAIVGSTGIDFLLSREARKSAEFFLIGVFGLPCIFVMVLSINYYLVYERTIDCSRFAIDSLTTRLFVALSFLYVLFVKTNLYAKEDLNNGNHA